MLMIQSVACAAGAGELWDVVTGVLFETSNVSLALRETVDLDGERLETGSGTLILADGDTELVFTVETPGPDGNAVTSGYRLLTKNGKTTMTDSNDPTRVQAAKPIFGTTILQKTPSLKGILDIGDFAVGALDLFYWDLVKTNQTENGGKQIRFYIEEGKVPGLLNTVLDQVIGMLLPKLFEFGNEEVTDTLNRLEKLNLRGIDLTVLLDAEGHATELTLDAKAAVRLDGSDGMLSVNCEMSLWDHGTSTVSAD